MQVLVPLGSTISIELEPFVVEESPIYFIASEKVKKREGRS
jgi:hypothetical protein